MNNKTVGTLKFAGAVLMVLGLVVVWLFSIYMPELTKGKLLESLVICIPSFIGFVLFISMVFIEYRKGYK